MLLIIKQLSIVSLALVLTTTSVNSEFVHNGKIDVEEVYTINRYQEYVIQYPNLNVGKDNRLNTYRLRTWSLSATVNAPVLVAIRQERRVTSWEIPLMVRGHNITMMYNNITRTMCFDTEKVIQSFADIQTRGVNIIQRNFTLSLSTSSIRPIKVMVHVSIVPKFHVELDQKYTTTFTPSQPVFYAYDFSDMPDEVQTALLVMESNDDVCFTASIQPRLCPVKDLIGNIRYYGEYQTISTKGGITIERKFYPDGFFIVFVAKPDNYDCSQDNSLLPQPYYANQPRRLHQQSDITFELRTGKTDKHFVTAILTVFFTNLGLCLFIMIATVLFYRFGRYRNYIEVAEVDGAHLSTLRESYLADYLNKVEVKLSDFVKKGRRNNRKAMNYFWHVSNIAIFYGIPVVQLMVSYQRSVNASGDLDLCYHNYHCSHPYYFTDFNHIYSNIGYIMFGILFLGITAFRNWKMHNQQNCGIPKYHGLFYAMGVALILEGVLSACYHICPTQSNFQFDTSFMYMMAILIVTKLYQNRHPDINPSAYGTFFVLGVAVLLAVFGILFNSLSVMVVFIIFYIAFCMYIAFEVYYFGFVLRGWTIIYNQRVAGKKWMEAIKPIRIGTFVTLSIANILNFTIALTGIILYPQLVDFGTYLLGILMLNAILYTVFYITMKLVHKESLCVETILYGILAAVLWAFGGYFFINASTLWSVTPAESRKLNRDCIFMDFYDTHDIWHLISAPALFFSFMLLATLDDDLFNKPQNEINVF